MVKHTQTIRWLFLSNCCFSVFNHFVEFSLKGYLYEHMLQKIKLPSPLYADPTKWSNKPETWKESKSQRNFLNPSSPIRAAFAVDFSNYEALRYCADISK